MIIQLNEEHIFAHHGALPQERTIGQEYRITASLHVNDADISEALLHDELSGTVDYAEAHRVIVREMSIPSNLLEHVAHRTAKALLLLSDNIQQADVTITKVAPPIPGITGCASVSYSLPRRLVVLDFDGTLADTAQGILRTMKKTFADCGYSIPPDNEIRATIGLPLVQSIAQLAGIEGEELHKAVNLYRENFEEVGTTGIVLFPGVAETLHLLHEEGVRMAIATSRGHESVDALCRQLGIRPYISHIVACEDVKQAKPHPEAVLSLMQRTHTFANCTWVVGDTTFDIGMGRSAGAHTIGVTYGNHSREALEQYNTDFIVDEFCDVHKVILPF